MVVEQGRGDRDDGPREPLGAALFEAAAPEDREFVAAIREGRDCSAEEKKILQDAASETFASYCVSARPAVPRRTPKTSWKYPALKNSLLFLGGPLLTYVERPAVSPNGVRYVAPSWNE